MESCPVCYESFSSSGGGGGSLLPLQLPCGDVLCRGCISADLLEGSFFCPECGIEHKGNSADDIGTPVELEEEERDTEDDFSPVSRDTEITYSSGSRDSLFAQFTSRTSGGGGIVAPSPSPKSTERNKGFGDRYGICKEPNCQNKACGQDGQCFNHSTNKKMHLVQENKLAKLLARTSLDFVQINSNQTSFKYQSRSDDWPDADPEELIDRFKRQERMELGEAMTLINRARDILRSEPNVLKLEAPVTAVGDIHGQFFDLLNMFEVGGYPSNDATGYVFLGDYVDRGSFSCEVMLTLLAYKVAYPEKVWLIRGNHECASVSGHFGFKEECKMKYGVQLYYRFLLLFQTMPLAALVATAYGDLFACHGGLSPDILTVEDLDELDRFVEPEENSALLDILWSDPISEDRVDEMTDAEYEEFISLEWRPNPTRGCSYCYGYKAVHDFLNRNSIVCLVRAHEVQEDGFHKHFDPAMIESRIQQSAKYKRKLSNRVTALRRLNSHEHIKLTEAESHEGWHYPSHDIPTVITVFSAPNYCDRYDNQGAILRIAMGLDGFQFLQYSCVPHPIPDIIESQMHNQIMSVIEICPYMPTSFKDFVRVAIELGHEDSLIEESNESDDVVGEYDDAELVCRNRSDALTPPPIPCSDIMEQKNSPPSQSMLAKIFDTSCDNASSQEEKLPLVGRDVSENNFPFSSNKPPQHSTSPPSSTIPAVTTTTEKCLPKATKLKFHRNSSMPIYSNSTVTISARSDSSPPRSNKQGNDDSPLDGASTCVKRHNSMKPYFRRTTDTSGGNGSHTSYTSPYLLAHASDAINELHPGRVQKYMDNFDASKSPSDRPSKSWESMKKDSSEVDEDDGFKKRIHHLIEQFDKQSVINTNKFEEENKKLKDGSSSNTAEIPRRSASLNFLPSAPRQDLAFEKVELIKKKSSGVGDTPRNVSKLDTDEDDEALFKQVGFTKTEVLALRLLFSLFDRSGTSTVGYEDLVAYGEETGGLAGIRDAADALAIVDIDGDGVIGLLDFIHFAARLRDTELRKDE